MHDLLHKFHYQIWFLRQLFYLDWKSIIWHMQFEVKCKMFLLLKFVNVELVFCNCFAGVSTGVACFETYRDNIPCWALLLFIMLKFWTIICINLHKCPPVKHINLFSAQYRKTCFVIWHFQTLMWKMILFVTKNTSFSWSLPPLTNTAVICILIRSMG